jgi:hypothetical protein
LPVPWKLNRRDDQRIDLELSGVLDLTVWTEPIAFRKEVIQPQVPLQLPCYDFTPIALHTMDGCPPCGLAHRLPVQTTFVM